MARTLVEQLIRGSTWWYSRSEVNSVVDDQRLTLVEELSSRSHLSRTSDPSLTLLEQLSMMLQYSPAGRVVCTVLLNPPESIMRCNNGKELNLLSIF
jgi:hypothetical protein